MSHSKRNTSLAFFTSYERSLLRNSWGSQSTRLTRDSFLPFASCRLCLLPARDPVACSGGSKADVFCRECALNDLVAQRKEIKRLEREWEDRKVDKNEAEKLNKEEDARRELESFERTAQGLEVNGLISNGTRKKRKVEKLESAELPGSRKMKSGDDKVDGTVWADTIEKLHSLISWCICRPRHPSGYLESMYTLLTHTSERTRSRASYTLFVQHLLHPPNTFTH